MVSKPPLTPEELDTREAELTARLARIEELEAQAIRREKAAKEREKAKKQVLLRLKPSLCPLLIQYSALARISTTPCGTAPAVTFSSSTG